MFAFVFVASWMATGTTFVAGLNLTFSRPRATFETTGELIMACYVTEKDVSVVYKIEMRRETISGWETLAFIEAGVTEIPTLSTDIVYDKEFVVGGILDKENPLNTHLSLEMSIEKMTYDDATVYRCEMTYKSNIFGSTVSVKGNAKLLMMDVSALNFTLSEPRVILGTTGKFFMTCGVSETDASEVYDIVIRRETNLGWQNLAMIEACVDEPPALDKDIINDKDFVVTGILDITPLSAHLTVQMNKEKMSPDDARTYRCEMTYKTKRTGHFVIAKRNASLAIDDTLQNSICVSKTTTVILGAILGVVIMFFTIYASYVTVVLRRIRERNLHCGRCEMLKAAPTNDTSEIQNSSDEV